MTGIPSIDAIVRSSTDVRAVYGDTDSIYSLDPDTDLFYEPWPDVDLEDFVDGLGYALAMRKDGCSICHKDLRVIIFTSDINGRPPKKKVAFHRTSEEGAACKMLHIIQTGGRV